jgi:hypothetical protein
MFTREGLAQILSQGAVTVKFTKVDGDERVMHCTIAEHLIPEDMVPKTSNLLTGEYFPPNMAVLKVFDLDIKQWRSFRVDSVKEMSLGYKDLSQTNLLLE